MIIIILLACIVCCPYVHGSQKTICVMSTDERNASNAEVNCHEWCSFESAILEIQNETTISIYSEQIQMTKKALVYYKDSICLKGVGEVNTKVICTAVNTGFAFNHVSNLQISNIDFVECSLNFINQTVSERKLVIVAAIFIVNSTNITIAGDKISKSLGLGMIFSQTHGNVTVYDSIFEHNGCSINQAMPNHKIKGGGLYIELKHSVHIDTLYTLYNCEFSQNNSTDSVVIKSDNDKYWDAKVYDFTQGGGITVFFEQNRAKNVVIIDNCKIYQNQANSGGGVIIVVLNDFSDHSEKSKLIVQNSVIVNNTCQRHGGGVGIYFSEGLKYEEPITEFFNCTIEQNSAKIYGGGVRIVTAKSNKLLLSTSNQFESIIVFIMCLWTKNSALLGSAIDIFPQQLDHKYPQTILLSDCTIRSNMIRFEPISDNKNVTALYQHQYNGKGALSCTQFILKFNGTTTIENNNGSAVHLSSCHLKFENESNVYFANNTGHDGGAIVLIGQSKIEAGDNNKFCFQSNTASWRGGAIMYFSNSKQDFISSKSCFMEFKYYSSSKNFPLFHFQDNNAPYGQAIFASTLRQCARYCANKENISTSNASTELRCIGVFHFDEHKPVAASGSAIYTTSVSDQKFLLAQPGQTIDLDFKLRDSHLQESYDIFHVSVQNTKFNGNVTINPSYSYIAERKKLRFSGRPGDTAIISLTSTEFQPITVSIAFEVQLASCQPGFVITEDLECACSITQSEIFHYVGIHRCDSRRGKAYIVHGYWTGYTSDSVESEDTLVTGHCPRGFCDYATESDSSYSSLKIEYALPNTSSNSALNEFVCSFNRIGILCGSCKQNSSVYFHGSYYECKPNTQTCRFGPLFFILSELLPVTILFIGVIFFNVQFTSGAVNSLIFFAQIVDMMHIDANGLIKKHPLITSFQGVYLLFYRMFNLDFFSLESLSYCLMENAMALDILAFKYLTITYSLLFVITCIIILKFCNPYLCLKKYFTSVRSYKQYIKQSAIHGLVAILVMCYSQCTVASLSILTPGYVYWRGYAKNRTTLKVVYLSGNLVYFGTEHMKYAIPAIIFTIFFTIIPPLCLIVYPLCYKIFVLCHIEETLVTRILCQIMPLERIKPIFDSVQGCFKDKYRFFGGLYFLYRFIILGCFTASKRPIEFYTLLEVQLIMIILVHAISQPYNTQWHNILDVSLLSLLATINIMTIYNYHTLLSIEGEINTNIINVVSIVQTALAYIPLVCLFIFCVTKIVLITREHCRMQKDYACENEFEDTLALVDYRNLNTEETESSQDNQADSH